MPKPLFRVESCIKSDGHLKTPLSCDSELESLVKEHESFAAFSLDLLAASSTPTYAVERAMNRIHSTRGVEGAADRRYIGFGTVIDQVEQLAIERAQEIFSVKECNVQLASGTQANTAALAACYVPNAALLSMELTHGGHLSHGHARSHASVPYRNHSYGIDPQTGLIDYDHVRQLAHKIRPRVIIAGASSYPRKIDYVAFSDICREVDAFLLADISHIAGFVAAGITHPPIGEHVILSLTTYKTLCGPRGAMLGYSHKIPALPRAVFPGVQGSVTAAGIVGKAAILGDARRRDYKIFQEQVLSNAQLMSEALNQEGIDLITGGTDTHMVVIDLRRYSRSGRELEIALRSMGILLNRQVVPNDPLYPNDNSGLRLGTTAATIGRIQADELRLVCEVISEFVHSGCITPSTKARFSDFMTAYSARQPHVLFRAK